MSDERGAPRVVVKIPILILNPLSRDNRFAVEVNSGDISAKGVRIISPQMVRPNAHLELLIMPDSKEEMRVFGKILWVKQCDNHTWQAGISFSASYPDIIAKIHRFSNQGQNPSQNEG